MERFDSYIALGDSMSIDKYADAPDHGAASLLFRNDDAAWPEFQGRDVKSANPSARFRMLAEDGATSVDLERVVSSLERSGDGAISGRTLVTITIGGNDLLVLYGSPHPLREAPEMLARFVTRMHDVLRRVRVLYRDSVVLLSTIYDPTDGTGRVQSGRDVSAGLPLIEKMNHAIADAAAYCGARLVDAHGHFRGHGLRHRDTSYAHYHPTDPSGWIIYDIEPNTRGSSELRRLFIEATP